MREFIIATESNADLTKEFIIKNNILVIPHYYTIDEEVYGDGSDLTVREFYDAMRAQKKAATMASNPAVIEEKFTEIAKQGKDILFISFSSALSGGYGNIVMVSKQVMEEYPDMKIVVIDTLSATVGEIILIRKALALKEQGIRLEDTCHAVAELVPHLCVQFTVDDLNHLYRGGRLSKATAVVGTLANIKPILYIDKEGKLVALDKTRGRKKSLNALLENMDKRLGSFKDKQITIGVVHGDCEEDAQLLAALVRERFPNDDITILPIGPSIGAHSGPGAVGLIFLGDYR